MICPVCAGRGEVRKRFLWFFRWRRRCWKCRGTGRLEDGASKKTTQPIAAAGQDRRGESFREWADEDRSTWPSGGTTSHRDEPFVVGEGGRSGGAGGGASWDDNAAARQAPPPDDRDHPVIVDPFVGDVTAVATSDAGFAELSSQDADVSGSASDHQSAADESGSNSDAGTTY